MVEFVDSSFALSGFVFQFSDFLSGLADLVDQKVIVFFEVAVLFLEMLDDFLILFFLSNFGFFFFCGAIFAGSFGLAVGADTFHGLEFVD